MVSIELLGHDTFGGVPSPLCYPILRFILFTYADAAFRKYDAMHVFLIRRADALEGCMEGSSEEAELRAIVDAIEAYEVKRWPLGKEPGGKG